MRRLIRARQGTGGSMRLARSGAAITVDGRPHTHNCGDAAIHNAGIPADSTVASRVTWHYSTCPEVVSCLVHLGSIPASLFQQSPTLPRSCTDRAGQGQSCWPRGA